MFPSLNHVSTGSIGSIKNSISWVHESFVRLFYYIQLKLQWWSSRTWQSTAFLHKTEIFCCAGQEISLRPAMEKLFFVCSPPSSWFSPSLFSFLKNKKKCWIACYMFCSVFCSSCSEQKRDREFEYEFSLCSLLRLYERREREITHWNIAKKKKFLHNIYYNRKSCCFFSLSARTERSLTQFDIVV